MVEQAIYTDAVILIALVWGGSPADVSLATDHLNAGFADHADWRHACKVLGHRGLIANGQPLPFPTQTGKDVVHRYCPSGTPPRTGARELQGVLSTMPIVAEPVLPPSPETIASAIEMAQKELWRQFDQSMANLKSNPEIDPFLD
jgi:hypothetical protein